MTNSVGALRFGSLEQSDIPALSPAYGVRLNSSPLFDIILSDDTTHRRIIQLAQR
jgi:hypothetical protein